MRQETVFVATDGRQFKDRKQCSDHEDRLFNAWLKSEDGRRFADFIKAGDENPDRERRRRVIREYWEWSGGE